VKLRNYKTTKQRNERAQKPAGDWTRIGRFRIAKIHSLSLIFPRTQFIDHSYHSPRQAIYGSKAGLPWISNLRHKGLVYNYSINRAVLFCSRDLMGGCDAWKASVIRKHATLTAPAAAAAAAISSRTRNRRRRCLNLEDAIQIDGVTPYGHSEQAARTDGDMQNERAAWINEWGLCTV